MIFFFFPELLLVHEYKYYTFRLTVKNSYLQDRLGYYFRTFLCEMAHVFFILSLFFFNGGFGCRDVTVENNSTQVDERSKC